MLKTGNFWKIRVFRVFLFLVDFFFLIDDILSRNRLLYFCIDCPFHTSNSQEIIFSAAEAKAVKRKNLWFYEFEKSNFPETFSANFPAILHSVAFVSLTFFSLRSQNTSMNNSIVFTFVFLCFVSLLRIAAFAEY